RLLLRSSAPSVGHPLLGAAELEGGEQDHERHQDHGLRRRKTELQPFEAVLPRAVDQDRGRVAGPTLRHRMDQAEGIEEREGHVSVKRKNVTGESSGKVTAKKRRIGPAPSTLAASRTEASIACNPAR